MSDSVESSSPTTPAQGVSSETPNPTTRTASPSTESRVAEISSLLSALEDAASGGSSPAPSKPPVAAPAKTPQNAQPAAVAERSPVHQAAPDQDHPPEPDPIHQRENQLVQVRLGMASGLFVALRQKHSQTASHCLRVALGCSSWAFYKKLDAEAHDVIELAALLHDIGKFGVPDAILRKQEELTDEEQAAVARFWIAGLDILRSCGCSDRVVETVKWAGLRFDGQGSETSISGERIPLEARMIAIVDAFDSMTSACSHRAAMPREQAIDELHSGSGSQFDPILVKQFADLLSKQQDLLTERVASRWLQQISTSVDAMPWNAGASSTNQGTASGESSTTACRSLFEQKLVDAMHDGVLFVDRDGRIDLWSKGAERLTGVSSGAAAGRQFTPGLLDVCNSAGKRIPDDACPVRRSLHTRSQLRQRVQILGRKGRHAAIDLHSVPVISPSGELLGATVLLHDAQSEASLEEKCEALHAKVTLDPMTQVANRAEFDRMHRLFMETHEQANLPCSLIMIDIDHFKRINDTFGHQAGDEAIITVANLLKTACRSGDLVARYGGEEFAMLCADCGNAAAAARAEQIRRKLAEIPHVALGNKRISASFGVTELQPDEDADSMLRRADQALLKAKEQGRNQVVQLGEGMDAKRKRKKRWWSFGGLRAEPVAEAKLISKAPVDITIEKLRGFVTDNDAKIVTNSENHVEIEISSEATSPHRRRDDRRVMFRVEVRFPRGIERGKGKRPQCGRSRVSPDRAHGHCAA